MPPAQTHIGYVAFVELLPNTCDVDLQTLFLRLFVVVESAGSDFESVVSENVTDVPSSLRRFMRYNALSSAKVADSVLAADEPVATLLSLRDCQDIGCTTDPCLFSIIQPDREDVYHFAGRLASE